MNSCCCLSMGKIFFTIFLNRSTEESFGSSKTPNSSLERKLLYFYGDRKKSSKFFPVPLEVAENPKFFESEISQIPSFAQNFVLKTQYWASEFHAEVGLQSAEERFLTLDVKAGLFALQTASKLFERSEFPRSSVTISSSENSRFKLGLSAHLRLKGEVTFGHPKSQHFEILIW